MNRKRRRVFDPRAGAETSSSPLTPSNDAHLQSDLLNITRLLEHVSNTNNFPPHEFSVLKRNCVVLRGNSKPEFLHCDFFHIFPYLNKAAVLVRKIRFVQFEARKVAGSAKYKQSKWYEIVLSFKFSLFIQFIESCK